MLQSHFQIEVQRLENGTVLVLTGELDVAATPTFEETVATVSDSDPLIVDLRGLEFIDSTGLGVIVRLHQQTEEQQHEFGLIRGTGQVERLLGLTGLADRIPVAEPPVNR
jgi:anti-sigma B factor antagonist